MNTQSTFFAMTATVLTFGMVSLLSSVASADSFDVGHDYLSSGVAGTDWDGINNAGNASIIDASTTNAGQLTITTNSAATTGWDGNLQTGPMLYQQVTGDFIATVVVSSGTAANYNVGSLLARDPSAGTVADEHFFSANYNFFGTAGVQRRYVNAGSTTKFDSTTIPASASIMLRLTRVDDDFTAAYSTDGGTIWADMAPTTTMGSMPDTIELGLAAANYGTNSYAVVFDDFTVGGVPEPSALGLLLAGAGLIVARRR